MSKIDFDSMTIAADDVHQRIQELRAIRRHSDDERDELASLLDFDRKATSLVGSSYLAVLDESFEVYAEDWFTNEGENWDGRFFNRRAAIESLIQDFQEFTVDGDTYQVCAA